jgi:hypothetical protein
VGWVTARINGMYACMCERTGREGGERENALARERANESERERARERGREGRGLVSPCAISWASSAANCDSAKQASADTSTHTSRNTYRESVNICV